MEAQWIGTIAGILTASSMLPQVIKTIKDKHAADVSIAMLLVLTSGNALWMYYGILKDDYPIIITNCFSVLVNLTMLGLRIKYK